MPKIKWGGKFENAAILVAITVNEDSNRKVLGAAEGMKEDKSSWGNFSSGCVSAAGTGVIGGG